MTRTCKAKVSQISGKLTTSLCDKRLSKNQARFKTLLMRRLKKGKSIKFTKATNEQLKSIEATFRNIFKDL